MGWSKKSDRAIDACRGRIPGGVFVVRRHCDTGWPLHPASESAASRYVIVDVDRDDGAEPTSFAKSSRCELRASGAPNHAPPIETLAPVDGIHRTRQLDQSSAGAVGPQVCQALSTSAAADHGHDRLKVVIFAT